MDDAELLRTAADDPSEPLVALARVLLDRLPADDRSPGDGAAGSPQR